ncbi:Protein RGF1 INDUCIBLE TRANSCRIPTION FACTOR 1, partial [Linum perenne]
LPPFSLTKKKKFSLISKSLSLSRNSDCFFSLRSLLRPILIVSSPAMVGREMYMENSGRNYQSQRSTSWIETLLSSEFFEECETHMELRKNEKNVFCLDCRVLLCRHCLKSSSNSCIFNRHRRLQICKYVYQYVARLLDVQNFIDCSLIQTYKINGEMAVHLNPRPIQKDAKPSTKAKFGAACLICGRYLQDLPNRFCSIACKVSGCGFCILGDETVPLQRNEVPKTPCVEANGAGNENEGSASALTETTSGNDEENERETEQLTPSPFLPGSLRRRSHRRKGVPHRSPLF